MSLTVAHQLVHVLHIATQHGDQTHLYDYAMLYMSSLPTRFSAPTVVLRCLESV